LAQMFTFLRMKLVNLAVERPHHIIVHALRSDLKEANNIAFESNVDGAVKCSKSLLGACS
jgi:hypothetical protein